MVGTVEESILGKIAEQTDVPFDREQLEEIYMMIGDASFQKISRRAKINVLDDEPAGHEQPEQVQYILPKKKKVGLFTALAAFAAGSALVGKGMMDTVTATAPTARLTTGIAMAAGTMGKATSTAVNLAATRGTGVCKRYKIYIAYTKNTAGGHFN